MNKLKFLALVVLLGAVVASALSVVASKYESRKLFRNLQSLEGARDGLEVEWGQLQLEQYTLATQTEIERNARSLLSMKVPETGDTVMVVRQ